MHIFLHILHIACNIGKYHENLHIACIFCIFFCIFFAYFAYQFQLHILHILHTVWHVSHIILHIVWHILHVECFEHKFHIGCILFCILFCIFFILSWMHIVHIVHIVQCILCILCIFRMKKVVLRVFIVYCHYCLVPQLRAQLFRYHHLQPSPLFADLSQKALGKSAASRRMANGIDPVDPTGTRGGCLCMEDTGITYHCVVPNFSQA